MSWKDTPQIRDVARYAHEGGDPQVILSDEPYIHSVAYARCCRCGRKVDVTYAGFKRIERLLKAGKFFCTECGGDEDE
jgi:hypothetical protein